MPVEHALFLAQQYAPALEELSARFGGHAAWWRHAALHVADGAGDNAELVYPFYDSPLWPAYAEQETGDRGWIPPLQSGTLSELSRAPRPRDQDAAEPAEGHR
jgi:hypothetical protein